MSSTLTPLTVQRLAYVRYLYQEGIEQSRQPAPLSARALTSFHDGVENFIGLVAEYLGVELKPRMEFLQYWEVIKPEFELPGKAQMKRLNDARVALKHNGSFPGEHSIEQARDTVVDFFTTVTPKVFNVDFDSVDMVDLVNQPETARLLHEAQTHADKGDHVHAMAGLSLAFGALLNHYSWGGTSYGWQQSPFSFGPSLYHSDRPRRPKDDTDKGLAKVMDVAQQTQMAMRMISLGIDYPGYSRFAALAPQVHGYADGSRRYVAAKAYESLSAEDYSWARYFVIESALRSARADGVRELLVAQKESNRSAQAPFEERSWIGPAEDS